MMTNHADVKASRITNLDFIVVFIYFVLVVATGLYSAVKAKNRASVTGYFLAGRFITWFPVGASLFATNIGSEHFIGLAGSGAATGIGVASFELNALLILQVTGWIFLPVYIASRVCTLPEYMRKRFGGRRIQTYLAILSLLLYVFTKISVNLYSGAIFIQQALGWDIYLSVNILVILTGISTIFGGLTAVIYTDTVQCFVILIGASVVAHRAFAEIGSWSNLKERYFQAIPSIVPNNSEDCAKPRPAAFQMLRSIDDPDVPWLGFLVGQSSSSLWYWCTDQVIVQRLLAAKNLSHAQGGTLFAGFLKIFPMFIIIVPGMIARILFTDEVACVDPDECFKHCHSTTACSNSAYPKLVLELLPSGFRGLMMAGILAAIMSGLSSIFNSASTMFTMDLWPLLRKKPSVNELMIVGRLFTIIMVVISIAWIPVIQTLQGGELYIYIQSIGAYLSPPIAATYVLSVLWTRMNEFGAFWSLTLGLIIGSVRMIMEMIYREPACGEIDARPFIIKGVHYMYFAFLLFAFTIITGIILSLMTDPPDEVKLIRTTYWTQRDKRSRDDEMSKTSTEMIEMKVLGEKTPETPKVKKKTFLKKVSSFFWGLEDTNKRKLPASLLDRPFEDALKQTTLQKIILNTFLVILVSIAISFFVGFSIH